METTINQVGDVEYDLEILISADDLAPNINQALRKQRALTSMKGFRQGKVPLTLIKKMYGRAVAAEVTEKKVQEIYEETVLNAGKHEVLGQPTITKLDYELDGDLQAIVHFGVRPEITLTDHSNERISKLVHVVTKEEIDEELENLRKREADLIPVEEDGIGESDQVVIDMQELDKESESLIIGRKQEDATFFLDDNGVSEELKSALLGLVQGSSTRVTMSHEDGDHVHAHFYEVIVKEVKRRELPDLDDAFIKEHTKEKVEDLDAYREYLKDQLTNMWERQSKNLVEGRLIDRMLDLYPAPVPESVIDMYLDSYVKELMQKSKNQLPEHFDEQAYRRGRRSEAEDQARWMLIRDAFVKKEEIEVTEEDVDAYFEEQGSGSEEYSPSVLRQYYQAMNMVDGVREQLLNAKVFDSLASQFNVEEKDRDAYNKEMEELRERRAAEAATNEELETSEAIKADPEGEKSPAVETDPIVEASPAVENQ